MKGADVLEGDLYASLKNAHRRYLLQLDRYFTLKYGASFVEVALRHPKKAYAEALSVAPKEVVRAIFKALRAFE